MKRLKIGILTFWWSNDNYGQLLQCYALQSYLKSKGHEVFVIDYDYRKDINKTPLLKKLIKALNPKKLFTYLRYKKRTVDVLLEQKKNDRQFDLFRKKYITFSSQEYNSILDLKKNPPEADLYIVGSDQVWNFLLWDYYQAKNIIHAYLLDFGNAKTKRISYAASWGITQLPEEFRKEIAPLLKKFNYISVREQSGINLCKECGCDDSEWVCDPTLLLGCNIYRGIYDENNIRKPKGKYIMLYMLSNSCDFNIQTVYDYAKSQNLDMIYVTGNGVIDGEEKFFATIPEWLYLIDNSEYVVTNSFHCAVFCTLFHKQFGVICLTGKDVEMNSRFDSLFDFLGMEKRYITNYDFTILDQTYEIKKIRMSEKFLEIIK